MGHDSASDNAIGSHQRDQVVREGGGDQTISVSQNVAQVSNVAHLGITTSVGVLQVTEKGREEDDEEIAQQNIIISLANLVPLFSCKYY